MEKSAGYSINAQRKTPGKPTTGGSEVHNRMKPGILSGEPKDNASCAYNKNMYKNIEPKN